ncbi:MAG TPA: response regulator [Methanotrichaceae archaeon]|nr:response regulator [Methanotrichaceae archaeon]
MKILLADDDTVTQKAMVKLLKKIGLSADVVSSGLEAIYALQKRSYDVVLMDVQMPKMDGLETTKAIRDRWPYRNIKIIAVTSCTQKGDRETCIQAGMDDYIPKPAKGEDIMAALDLYHKC